MLKSKGLRKALGIAVRQLRVARGLSQEQLAEECHLHRNYIGMVERGEQSPSLDATTAIASGLGLATSSLIARAEVIASGDTEQLPHTRSGRRHPARQ